jgi:hypothetical protein
MRIVKVDALEAGIKFNPQIALSVTYPILPSPRFNVMIPYSSSVSVGIVQYISWFHFSQSNLPSVASNIIIPSVSFYFMTHNNNGYVVH